MEVEFSEVDIQKSAEEVLRNTSAEPEPAPMFVNISYASSEPNKAQLTANTIGQVLQEKGSEVSLDANGITATVWAPATLPKTPSTPFGHGASLIHRSA